MAATLSDSHGGRRDNSGRKRKHDGCTSAQRTWNSRHKRIYLSLQMFESWKEAKIVAGYENSSDNDFAAHLLSLEYRRRYILFKVIIIVFHYIFLKLHITWNLRCSF